MVLLALSYWYCFMDYVLLVLLKPRHHVNNGMPSFCSLCMLHLLIIVCHGVSVGCGQVVCYRFFKPTPQRYQMLAWALNPTFPKEKYLGSERAAMCDAVATNEIKRRQQTTETFTATEIRAGPKEAAPSKKRGASLMDAVDSMRDWDDSETEGAAILDEGAIYTGLSKGEIKNVGFVKEGKEGTLRFCSLIFWSKMQHRLPGMARIARSAYSVMATEANTERAFSASGACAYVLSMPNM